VETVDAPTHRQTDSGDVQPIVEMVDAPMPMIEDQAPAEAIARDPTDTEQETVPVSPPSSPVSTAATAVVAGQILAALTVRSTWEEVNEIMLILEKTMEKVREWSERVEAQTSATAERDVTIWKRRLANCEESLKPKVAALTEAEKGQAELRKALEAKDVELVKVRAELDTERRSHTNVEQLRRELREAQAEVKSLKRRNGVLRGDVDKARRNE
jgi:predicted RNase H-like nuclease (RuvC/YqgF family)